MLSKSRSFKASLLSLVLLVALVVSTLSPIPSLSANQSQIVEAMGAGWNLGNQLEANNNSVPDETAWGNPTITSSLIQTVKAAGFKTIRIPVSYLNYIGSAPDYTIDASWLARIKEVVDYAYNQGLYVIINIHGDGYNSITGAWLLVNSSDQTTIKEKYQKVWQQIANTFVDYDEHLIFESMNEVFDGTYSTPNTTYYSNLNDYNQIFVDTVRQTGGNNSTRWLLIPGWNTNIDYTAGDYGFELPTDNYRSSSISSDEKRIMISAHYYSPWDFCGEESGTITQWGSISTDSSKKSTWGQEDYMLSQIQMMYNQFVTQGYPVVIGEWGSIDKTSDDSTNNTYREYFAETLCSYCIQYGAVPVYWDNGYNGNYGFGLFNRSSNTVTQQGIIDAIMEGMGTTTPTTTPTPTPTATPTPTPGVSTGYAVNYQITNDWGSGGSVNVTIKNNSSSAVNGWTLDFTFPGDQEISNLWCGAYTQNGASVSVDDAEFNAYIEPDGGTVSFGFNVNYGDSNTAPTSFTLNGSACTTY